MQPAPPVISATAAPQNPMENNVALLVVSFFIGVPSFLAFATSSLTYSSPLWSLSALVCAYCFGFVSSTRLMRSGRQGLLVLGLLSLLLQSFVMLFTWILAHGIWP
jgi:hypothetical protein